MGKFDGYLILSDLDGTLTEKEIMSKENMAAIRYFQHNGGIFTVATGRMPDFIMGYKNGFVPNAPVIAINGTLVYDLKHRKTVYEYPLGNEYFEAVKYAALNYDCVCRIFVNGLSESRQWVRDDSDDINKLKNSDGATFHKAVFVLDSEEGNIALKKDLTVRFGDKFSFDRSWSAGLEMHIKGSGKGECIEIVKKSLNKKIHTSIGVGDYENDISLIKMADIGYATENAIQEVKAVADKMAPSNAQNAIAYIINNLKTAQSQS